MNKTELKLKNNLTENDTFAIVESAVDFIVGKNEDGTVYYTPYLKKHGLKVAIALHAIEGIEFEKDDNVGEIVETDRDIKALINWFLNDNLRLISEIKDLIDDISNFRKQYFIHNNDIIVQKTLQILEEQEALENMKLQIAKKENKVLTQQIESNKYLEKVFEQMTPDEVAQLEKKIASGEFDQEKLVNTVLQHMDNKNNIIKTNNRNFQSKGHTSKSKPRKNSKSNYNNHQSNLNNSKKL